MGMWMVGGEAGRTIGPIVIVTAISGLTLEGTPVLMVAGFAASAVLYFKLRTLPAPMTDGDGRREWRVAIRRMRPVLTPLTGVIVARAFAVASFAVFLPTYLTEEGSRLWVAGASLSVLELAGVAGALGGGWVSDHIGRRRVMAAGLVLTALFAALFLVSNGWVRYPMLVGLGLSLFSFGPAGMALVQEQFPENRALANGIYMSIAFLIRSLAVVTIGAIGDVYGLETAFAVATTLVVIGVPFVFRLPRRPAVP
jgi:FSR family fosmidomycin resistance protein-like MFS transporter